MKWVSLGYARSDQFRGAGVEFVGEDAHGYRDGDAFGFEIAVAPKLPIEMRARNAARRFAKACEERIDFMLVTGYRSRICRTIAKFRHRHLPAGKSAG